jgi:tetratricopeptide (TPR) repeat protein
MKINRLMTFFAVALFSTFVNAQSDEINKDIAKISELLKNKATVKKSDKESDKDTKSYSPWGTQKNIFVFDDRIELRRKKELTIFYFSKLDGYRISYSYTIINNSTDTIETAVGIDDFLIVYEKENHGLKLYHNLIFIGNSIKFDKMEKLNAQQLILFEPIAAQYRALKVKPPVSEEQRKYIVQANLFNQQKMYDKAIDLYNKAIELDQTAYPAAYSNLALLSAQVKNFYAAIYFMKKYLLLEPEASDARGAQDKIYEWEAQVAK